MPPEAPPVESRIHEVCGQRVTPSSDLAEPYGVLPSVLVQAVKRDAERLPSGFMFRLSRGSTLLRGVARLSP